MTTIVQTQPIVIRAAATFDGDDLREGATTEILVIDGRIAEIGEQVSHPADAEIIDLTDATVSPGFIDTHVHAGLTLDRMLSGYYVESSALKTLYALPGLAGMLDTGFTTVRDLGSLDSEYSSVALKKGIELGLIPGPRMIVAPRIISGTGGHGEAPLVDSAFQPRVRSVVDGVDAIRATVRSEIMNGADWIKVAITGFFGDRPGEGPGDLAWSLAEMEACVETARDYSVDTTVHAVGDEGIRRGIVAGARSIEHGSLISDASLALMKEKGTYLVPTLRVVVELFSGGVVSVTEANGGSDAPRPTFGIFALEKELKEAQKRIVASDVPIAYGSDCGGETPLDLWKEFLAMDEVGIAPLRALRSATSVASDLLRRPDLGRLQVGNAADIIAIDGDPLTDLTATTRVPFVMKGGVVHRRA